MKRGLCIASALLALLVAGCAVWDEPASITLKDGTTIDCPLGISFADTHSLKCYIKKVKRSDTDYKYVSYENIQSISRKLDTVTPTN